MRQVSHHPRDWRGNLYVYPVISRRSRGLSIGINLNPDTACNFDCVYCQVDRTGTPRIRAVDTDIVRDELQGMISVVRDASLFKDADFADVPADWRAIKDIAFSGDGEPTTCKHFATCVEMVADASLAREVLGWQPQYTDIESIVASAWHWHKAHPLGYDDRER